MLRIVMDGASDLPRHWAEDYDLQIIPINIQFGERTYLQGVDLSNAEFYQLAGKSGRIPQTSQPSPQQFIDFYRRIATVGETILSIHVTSKLSGTFDSAQMAARELAGEYEVIPFDSASGSAAMAYMGKEARMLARAGASLQAILARLNFIRQNIAIILTLNSLEFARRSGRVRALQAALASVLNVKPVVALKDGALDMADRVRTRRRALEYVVEAIRQRVGDQLVNMAVVHAEDPASGEVLFEMVRERFKVQELIMTELSIAVAANLGPGTVGIVAYPVS